MIRIKGFNWLTRWRTGIITVLIFLIGSVHIFSVTTNIMHEDDSQITENNAKQIERFAQVTAELSGTKQSSLGNVKHALQYLQADPSQQHFSYTVLPVSSRTSPKFQAQSDNAGYKYVLPIQYDKKSVGIVELQYSSKAHLATILDSSLMKGFKDSVITLVIEILLLLMMFISFVFSPVRDKAERDSMTGLMNQTTFWANFRGMSLFAKEKKRHVALITMDIDDFKKINDTFGHQKGDEVIQLCATTIKKTIRKGDVAGRVGGEEFSIALMDCTAEDAYQIAERIRSKLSENKIGETQLSASIGICSSVEVPLYDSTIIANYADEAMYSVKRNGKNGVRIYTPSFGL